MGPVTASNQLGPYIKWRVEGTGGVAEGSIGWPAYPNRQPSEIRYLTSRQPGMWFNPQWREVWFPDAFAGPMADLINSIVEETEPGKQWCREPAYHGAGGCLLSFAGRETAGSCGRDFRAECALSRRRVAIPTIKHVALRAEVSVGTVSRVLNDRPDVNQELRQRVESAIRELRYKPNARAQSFTRERSHIIAFVLCNGNGLSMMHSQLLLGIEEYCSKGGYSVLFARSQHKPGTKPERMQLPGSSGKPRLGGLFHCCREQLR